MCVQPISGDDQPVFESAVLTDEELAALNGLAEPITNEDGREAWLVPMWGTAVQGGVVGLEDVTAIREVRNRWMQGWGIRKISGG